MVTHFFLSSGSTSTTWTTSAPPWVCPHGMPRASGTSPAASSLVLRQSRLLVWEFLPLEISLSAVLCVVLRLWCGLPCLLSLSTFHAASCQELFSRCGFAGILCGVLADQLASFVVQTNQFTYRQNGPKFLRQDLFELDQLPESQKNFCSFTHAGTEVKSA